MNDQEKKCLKLQEDYQKLVQAKEEFDAIFTDIKKEKVNTNNMKQISKIVNEAKIKKQEIKNRLEAFTPEIIREIIKKEQKKLSEFFGEEIKVPNPPREITKERIEQWAKQGFELHYLPEKDMSKKKDLKTWKNKAPYIFEYMAQKKVESSAITIAVGWILIDGREKPKYKDGEQMYEDDVLGGIIEKLRKIGMIHEYKKNPKSRFNISWDELNKDETKKAFADVLGVKPDKIDLPRVIEWNVIGNIHHSQWGETDAWEWYKDECKGDYRLYGGNVEYDGFTDVNYKGTDYRDDNLGFRLLVRF